MADSRLVGEREERLSEALTEICEYTSEHGGWADNPFAGPGKVAGRIHDMARRAIEPPDGALASSPSPPDREQAVEKVAQRLASGHGGCTGGCEFRPCDVDYTDAEAIVTALFGPVREDDVQERPDEADRHLRILEGLGKPTPSDPFQAEQLLDAVRRMVAAETALLREALFGPVRGDES